MDIVSVALKRYSTKAFDPSKKLTAEEADKIKIRKRLHRWRWYLSI